MNNRNYHYIVKSTVGVKCTISTKQPAQVMFFGITDTGGKNSGWVLIPILRYHILSWFKLNYPDGYKVLTWNGTLSYIAKKEQKFFKTDFADFGPIDFWLTSDLDMNSLDDIVL